VTPEQIANSALEAADAGAAIVHCHVRDPETGKGARAVALYADVMERIRAKNADVIINLTAGMGGDLEIGDGEQPMAFGPGTDLVGPSERLAGCRRCRVGPSPTPTRRDRRRSPARSGARRRHTAMDSPPRS
jgi:uncharacterized protein (DUF849 family)